LLSEKLTAAETRIRNQELEIIQLGQDKRYVNILIISLLIDDVAELRNNSDVRAHKIKSLTAENTKLSAEVDKFRRDISQIQEFSSLIDQAESNGQNYLQMMRNLKTYLTVGDHNIQGHDVSI
jgi:regulator of replication initiation timing